MIATAHSPAARHPTAPPRCLPACPPPCPQVKTAAGSFVGVYLRYMIPGILLLIIFALVIPGFWFLTVYLNRHRLDVRAAAPGWLACWLALRPRAIPAPAAWAPPRRPNRIPPRTHTSPLFGAALKDSHNRTHHPFLHPFAVQDPLVQAKYGFLYASYSERLPYWETTEMIRKFAIAFIPVSGCVICHTTSPHQHCRTSTAAPKQLRQDSCASAAQA